MQLQIVAAFVFGCVLAGASIAANASRNAHVVSPLPDSANASVLGEVSMSTPTTLPTATPIPTLAPTRKPTPRPTRKPNPTPIIVTSSELDGLFTKYSQEYSVDKELLKRIANCESGMNPNATNRNYVGLFQFSEGIWTSTRTLMGQNADINLRFNAEESIRTAAFMVSQNHLAIWPNCNK